MSVNSNQALGSVPSIKLPEIGSTLQGGGGSKFTREQSQDSTIERRLPNLVRQFGSRSLLTESTRTANLDMIKPPALPPKPILKNSTKKHKTSKPEVKKSVKFGCPEAASSEILRKERSLDNGTDSYMPHIVTISSHNYKNLHELLKIIPESGRSIEFQAFIDKINGKIGEQTNVMEIHNMLKGTEEELTFRAILNNDITSEVASAAEASGTGRGYTPYLSRRELLTKEKNDMPLQVSFDKEDMINLPFLTILDGVTEELNANQSKEEILLDQYQNPEHILTFNNDNYKALKKITSTEYFNRADYRPIFAYDPSTKRVLIILSTNDTKITTLSNDPEDPKRILLETKDIKELNIYKIKEQPDPTSLPRNLVVDFLADSKFLLKQVESIEYASLPESGFTEVDIRKMELTRALKKENTEHGNHLREVRASIVKKANLHLIKAQRNLHRKTMKK